MALYNFVNFYVVNTATTPAEKELNSIDFVYTGTTNSVIIDDDTGSRFFAGNDVSAIGLVLGGSTYYGWISRPIKAGGVVKGFYFWTDAQFITLAAAQADGNTDSDRNAADNSGFVLVIDQAYFDGLPFISGSLKNAGSSSDRVDSALNALLPASGTPVAVNDSLTVLEDSGAQTGNVLGNDTVNNGFSLSVSGFSIGGVAGVLGAAFTGGPLTGVGSFTLNANGSYSFTPAPNYAGSVPVVTYTVSDGSTGSSTAHLSIALTPVNDAPSGADRTITLHEGTAYTFAASDFGFTDPTDRPANALSGVLITTLPGAGTLALNGTPVTAGQTIAAANVTKLTFTPASDASGNAYASLTFQVQDSGGTGNGGANLDSSANTLTFNVSNVNSAPVAAADTVTAVEAGGAANGTAGSDPTRNAATGLLSNDSDPDSTTPTVATAGSAVTGPTAIGAGTAVLGRYGTLTLSSDGSFAYTVDNGNTSVQALRISGNTLTDSFFYTIADTGSLTASSTLTVTIQGANDNPVAAADYNVAKESTTAGGSGFTSTGYSATGNVLTNDTDVDASANGETRTVTGLSGSATASSAAGVTTLRFSTLPSNVSAGYYVFVDGDQVDNDSNPGTALRTAGNVQITIVSVDTVAKTFTLSGQVANVTLTDNQLLGFSNQAGGGGAYKDAAISSSTSSSATANISAASGTIAAGMTVTGTGVPASTTVQSVTYDGSGNVTAVTLSASASLSATTLTFTAAAGTTLTGAHGTLVLNANGSYTYTPTTDNASLGAGETKTDTFAYTMQDASGVTASSTLTISVIGAAPNDPDARADTSTAVEAGGVANATAGTNPTGNVLGAAGSGTAAGAGDVTDTTPGGTGTLSVVKARHAASAVETTLAGATAIGGAYGTLTINANGSYSYAVDNGNTAVQGLRTSGNHLTDTFFYRIRNSTANLEDVASLTVTIQGANDAPVAAVDSASAIEAGGSANGTAGLSPTGNVLANDTDVDSGDTLSVTLAGPGNTVVGSNTTIAGSYGTLTISSDGSYSYAANNGNAAVQALSASDTLTDVFAYSAQDAAGATTSAALTITINGANDAPVNTLPVSPTVAYHTDTPLNGLSVADPDSTSLTVEMSVGRGVLTIGNLGGATISAGSSGSPALTLSGTPAQINAALATLSYRGDANVNGTDTLTVTSSDGALVDVDTLDITVSADNRAITTSDLTVNEGSPYAVFTVTGAGEQQLFLALVAGSATSGSDYAANVEVWDGSAWVAYNGGPVAIPAGQTQLFARVPVLNDAAAEADETFSLTASNAAGSGATATATIVDDANGSIYDGTLTGGSPTSSSSGLDDDRPLTVSSPTVNEASPYVVFGVGGTPAQIVTLNLVNGTASNADHGTTLEVYDESSGTWVAYGATASIQPSGTLLVRTTITQDPIYEGPETLGLIATNAGDRSFVGTAVIADDGTGARYPGTVTGGSPDSSTSGLDNDLALSLTALGPVNEASTYAMYTVSATVGETLTLSLGNTASGADVDATIAGFTLEFSTDAGSSWTSYDAGTQPQVPVSAVVYIRADIGSESDTIAEGAETFTLTAQITTGAGASSTATTTIVDDGTGTRYPGTVTGGTIDTSTSGLDNDSSGPAAALTLGAISSHTSEAGASATFTVRLATQPTANVTVSLASSDLSEGSVGLATLTFTPANWSTNQTVTVSGVDDALVDGNQPYAVTLSAASGDLAYQGRSGSVSVVNDDNDVMRVGSVTANGPVTEGSPLVYAITLPAAGLSPASFPLLVGGTANGMDYSALTFTNGVTFSGRDLTVPAGVTDFAVTVQTVDDLNIENAENLTLSVGAASASATINDNDVQSVDAITVNGPVAEGSQLTYAVTLSAPSPYATSFSAGLSGSASASDWSGFELSNGVTFNSGRLFVPEGVTSFTVTFATTDDLQIENVESLIVTVGAVASAGTITDNDRFAAALDPAFDNGRSNSDLVTSVIAPEFTINANGLLAVGDAAVLLDPKGMLVGAAIVRPSDVARGSINVPAGPLDDGTYRFTAEAQSGDGTLKGQSPVTVTVVTDLDGVMPSVELVANLGDFNKDGVPDWQQSNVAQLPLGSAAAFIAGKEAPTTSFGAVLAGNVTGNTPTAAVKLDDAAQLLGLKVFTPPVASTEHYDAATPLYQFSVTSQPGLALTDLDPARAGLQTRIVVDLPQGVKANAFLKLNERAGAWSMFLDDGRLDTYDDGATLVDLNGDGFIDRAILTLTDGGSGDADGLANGLISADPGLLVWRKPDPVYSVRLANGDRYYTTSAEEAASKAQGTGNLFEGARFDSLAVTNGGRQLFAYVNSITSDWYFAADGAAMPYLCYQPVPTAAGFSAAAAGSGKGTDFHLFLNSAGLTQLVTLTEANALGLAANGYTDRGAVFATTTQSVFAFDPEGFLVANQGDAGVRALVQELSARYTSTSDAGFVDEVEMYYLSKVALVGLAHGGDASAADVAFAFGVHFSS